MKTSVCHGRQSGTNIVISSEQLSKYYQQVLAVNVSGCFDRFSFTLKGTAIFPMSSRGPLFKGPGYRNYKRNLTQIEYIFTHEFPNWQDSSAGEIPFAVFF